MQSRNSEFTLDPLNNIATDSVFNLTYDGLSSFPPIAGSFMLLDGTHFKLLDGTNFLLL